MSTPPTSPATDPSPPTTHKPAGRRHHETSDLCETWLHESRRALRYRQHNPHRNSGDTTLENLGPYCRRCHRLKQTPGWRIDHHPDGSATWHTPTGQRYDYTPPPIAEPVTITTDEDLGDPPF